MPLSKLLGPKTPWEATDVVALRQFLDTVSGKRYLAKMFSMRPRATEKSDPVKRSIQSGVQEGFEEMYNNAITLTQMRTADDAGRSADSPANRPSPQKS